MQVRTSVFVNVRIVVEPNKVEQTSPDTFAEVEKRFMTR